MLRGTGRCVAGLGGHAAVIVFIGMAGLMGGVGVFWCLSLHSTTVQRVIMIVVEWYITYF